MNNEGAAHASPLTAREKPQAEIVARFCALQARVAHQVIGFREPNDCFCMDPSRGGRMTTDQFRSVGTALDWIEVVVERALIEHAHRYHVEKVDIDQDDDDG